MHGPGVQDLPVNLFETPEELVVIAAMPGTEPEDISLELEKGALRISSQERGQDAEKKYLIKEWSYGSHARELRLETPVDAKRANVTYGNGVLTVVLPKSEAFVEAQIDLPKVGRARGAHQGRNGKEHRR